MKAAILGLVVALIIVSVFTVATLRQRNEALVDLKEVTEMLIKTNKIVTNSQRQTEQVVEQAEQAMKIADEALELCREKEE